MSASGPSGRLSWHRVVTKSWNVRTYSRGGIPHRHRRAHALTAIASVGCSWYEAGVFPSPLAGPGDYLDEAVPSGANKARMTKAQVRAGLRLSAPQLCLACAPGLRLCAPPARHSSGQSLLAAAGVVCITAVHHRSRQSCRCSARTPARRTAHPLPGAPLKACPLARCRLMALLPTRRRPMRCTTSSTR